MLHDLSKAGILWDNRDLMAVQLEFMGLVKHSAQLFSSCDIMRDSEDRAQRTSCREMTGEIVILPINVQEAQTLNITNIAQIGVASTRQPPKCCCDPPDSSAVVDKLENPGGG